MTYPFNADDVLAIDRLESFYNGEDYDAAANPGGFGHGGHRPNFHPALRDISRVGESVAAAADSANLSASQASSLATAFIATSTTSFAIGTGIKTFTIQSGKNFTVGSFVTISSNANPVNFMHGDVIAYSGSLLTVNVTLVGGSGSFNDWNIGLSGPQGVQGVTGAIGPAGLAGLRFLWSTSTAASDPTSGKIKVNQASAAASTVLHISKIDANVVDVSSMLSQWDDGTSAIKGTLTITDISVLSRLSTFTVSGTLTDNTTWFTVNISSGSGVLPPDGALVAVQFTPKGDKGDTGLTGATGVTGGVAINYTFSTITTDSDPGATFLRLNSAVAQNVSTVIRADLVDRVGADVTAVLDTFDDSSSSIKGQIRIFKISNPGVYIVFNVISIASPAGYRNITVVPLASSSANPFIDNDEITLTFSRSGDAGGGAATAISFTPSGNISSTNVQTAIQELDTEKTSANNSVLTGTTDIQQALKLSGDISPATITANQSDYNPTGLVTAAVLRLASDAAREITGLQGGDDGRVLLVVNSGSFSITLKNQNAGSSANNRFLFGGDIVLQPGAGQTLLYDTTGATNRWRGINTMGLTPLTLTGSSTLIQAGPNGSVNPTFLATVSGAAATGIEIVGQAAGTGSIIRAISSSADEGLTINAKGTGNLLLNSTAGSVGIGGVPSVKLHVTAAGAEIIRITDNAVANASWGFLAQSAGVKKFRILDVSNGVDRFTIDASGQVKIIVGTQSTTATTGSFVTAGGIGCGGNGFFNGSLNAASISVSGTITGGNINIATSAITAGSAVFSGNMTCNTLTAQNTGNLIPTTDNVYNLGIVSTRWTGLFTINAQARYLNMLGAPNPEIDFQREGVGGYFRMFVDTSALQFTIDNFGGTGVYLGHGAQNWAAFSDARLKKNVADYSVLDKLDNFRCVTFDLIDEMVDPQIKRAPTPRPRRQIGAIAQECIRCFPEVVDASDPEKLGIRLAEMGPIALQGLKEAHTLIVALARRVEELEGKIQ